MNYRYRQVKMMWAKDIAHQKQAWNQERHQFQQDILNLQNSTDAKIIENLEKDLQKKQTLLNDTVNLLGNKDIKSLSDIENLLKGKTLKELIVSHQEELETKIQNRNSEINKLAQQLDKTKEKLQFYSENLKIKESLISEYQTEAKEKDQALQAKTNLCEKLAKQKEKKEVELNQNLSLKESKIKDLETSLFNLSKQKLTNQKQAKTLVEEIEKEWTQKQKDWETQSQNQQDHFAQELAQTKANHSEEAKQLKTKHNQDQTRAIEQEKIQANQNLQRTKEEFETQLSVLNLNLETNKREIAEKETKITELEQWSSGQHERITELENNLNLANQKNETLTRKQQQQENQLQAKDNQIQTNEQTITQLNSQITNQQTNINTLQQANQNSQVTIQTHTNRITQLEENLRTSQAENNNKQTTINQLNQDKVNLQTRITNLTQTQTENTQLQATIQNLQEQASRQREALTQYLNNREQELTNHYNVTKFQAWLEEEPARKANLPEWFKVNSDKNLENLVKRIHASGQPIFNSEGWKPYQAVALKWINEKPNQEITLLKEILNHE